MFDLMPLLARSYALIQTDSRAELEIKKYAIHWIPFIHRILILSTCPHPLGLAERTFSQRHNFQCYHVTRTYPILQNPKQTKNENNTDTSSLPQLKIECPHTGSTYKMGLVGKRLNHYCCPSIATWPYHSRLHDCLSSSFDNSLYLPNCRENIIAFAHTSCILLSSQQASSVLYWIHLIPTTHSDIPTVHLLKKNSCLDKLWH
jgi:hypothetical protein